MKIRVVLEKDASGYYVADVSALPGCVSQGKTLQEARANIREAITGWVAVMNQKAKNGLPWRSVSADIIGKNG